IGSIGVIFSGFGFVDTIKKLGIERRIYTEGKNKAILDPFLPEEKDNIEILKNAQKDIFESFKELVLQRRYGLLKNENDQILTKNDAFLDEKIFTGAFWSGKTAQKLGLIDEISDLRSKMKQKFGKKIKIINIETKKSFLKSLFSSKNHDFIGNLLDEVENHAVFGRFGL
ncbi:MAG TPA: S49 family peptidase, partial [Rickettsiales bacterium]|nr:S49 family peptidase [Rickettsiales bacterium]